MAIDFVDNSKEFERGMELAVQRALEAIGNQAVSHAKQNLTEAGRVDTGNLRNSISHTVVDSEQAVYVGTNTSYAIYNEMGTGVHIAGGRKTPWVYKDASGNYHRTTGIAPTHFIRNSAQGHGAEYKAIAEKYLKGK